MVKHGLYNTPAYVSWICMKTRCYNKNHKKYGRYGGRGIKVCKSWINSFEQFYKDMGPRPEGTTLDRIDNNKGYSASNCKWSTAKEQNNNQKERKDKVKVMFKNKLRTLKEISELTGIKYNTIKTRYYRGKL